MELTISKLVLTALLSLVNDFYNFYFFIIIFSLILILISFVVSKNIIFENRAKKYTQEYVIILNLINNKKIEEAKKKLEILKTSKINNRSLNF